MKKIDISYYNVECNNGNLTITMNVYLKRPNTPILEKDIFTVRFTEPLYMINEFLKYNSKLQYPEHIVNLFCKKIVYTFFIEPAVLFKEITSTNYDHVDEYIYKMENFNNYQLLFDKEILEQIKSEIKQLIYEYGK